MLNVTHSRRIRAALLAMGIALTLSPQAWAAGPRYGSGSKSSAVERSPMAKVEKALGQQRYERALDLLESIRTKNPNDADAWNLTGFASRKLGRVADAHQAYARALEIDPAHKRTHEYLGELYLQTGDLAGAERQREILEGLCTVPCEELPMLEKAIANHHARGAR